MIYTKALQLPYVKLLCDESHGYPNRGFSFFLLKIPHNMIRKCLEIFKIFSKNSNSQYIFVNFGGRIRTHDTYETIL